MCRRSSEDASVTKIEDHSEDKEVSKLEKKMKNETLSVAEESKPVTAAAAAVRKRRRSQRLSAMEQHLDEGKDKSLLKDEVPTDSVGLVKQEPDELPVKAESLHKELKPAEDEVVYTCLSCMFFIDVLSSLYRMTW